MKRFYTSLPIWVVLADMIYGLCLNVAQSMSLRQTATNDITPDIAFNGLQLVSNGGMVLIIGFGLAVLLQLNRTVLKREILPIGIFRVLGLVAVLAFSAPSLWQWFWTLIDLASGREVLNLNNIRYLVTALCLPFIALLCLSRLFGWYRLHRIGRPVPSSPPLGNP